MRIAQTLAGVSLARRTAAQGGRQEGTRAAPVELGRSSRVEGARLRREHSRRPRGQIETFRRTASTSPLGATRSSPTHGVLKAHTRRLMAELLRLHRRHGGVISTSPSARARAGDGTGRHESGSSSPSRDERSASARAIRSRQGRLDPCSPARADGRSKLLRLRGRVACAVQQARVRGARARRALDGSEGIARSISRADLRSRRRAQQEERESGRARSSAAATARSEAQITLRT